MSTSVLSTVVDYVSHHESAAKRPPWGLLNSTPTGSSLAIPQGSSAAGQDAFEMSTLDAAPPEEDPELRLPKLSSLCFIIAMNALLQVTAQTFEGNENLIWETVFVLRNGVVC